MPNRTRTRPKRSSGDRSQRRADALRAASADTLARDTEPRAAAATSAIPAAEPERRQPPKRRRSAWAIVAVAAAALWVGGALLLGPSVAGPAASPSPTIVVGIPGGAAFPNETPTPSPEPQTTAPSPSPTVQPSPTPSVIVAGPVTPTAAPVPPAPATARPTAPPTPLPTSIIVAMVQPDDAVAAFYARVANGDFDGAYALWSERMKATYPRQENLDDRFDQTASITFHQLYVAEQGVSSATVQANFTETYDGGGSREFIGYWRLVLVDGRWLLDEPHY